MQGRSAGLTIVEVLVALLILTVMMAAAMSVYISTMVSNSGAAYRTRVTQVLSTVTDQITQHVLTLPEGGSELLVFQPGTPPTPVTLTSTPTGCSAYLMSPAGRAHYCVTVRNNGSFNPAVGGVSLLGVAARTYNTQACWNERGAVRCVEATTIY
ncbi:prepilin-type N-terminal cleavage/methylation domain-containing protein [Deinococcus sp. YIM 77859]|uniref:prepilin-type N-terminal cleavage/methylation domain-containing protein n=1 Tax=Deinococcus sp. YIM 77859 TaxID=1540221 RepID=UPI00055379A4|nr:prepilin-type N-terminal cleavage/methylation domain-containing protein [Deinococcus sp. YIM 77859]